MGLGQIALILGVVALLLGGSALGIALTSTGHTGARGPAGPGAVVNQATHEETQAVTNATCTAATGSVVGFLASGAGTVTMVATVVLLVSHTAGDSTTYYVSLANSAQKCNVFANNWVSGYVDYTAPTTSYVEDVTLVQNFPIAVAGTYAFDVVGNFTNAYGLDTTSFNSVSVEGVYLPS